MTLDEGRAALERGRPVVLVTPPAPEQAAAVWELAPGLSSGAGTPLLIACGDAAGAAAWAALAPAGRRAHAVTGLARATRVLKEHPPDVLVGAVDDLAALLARSALNCDAVTTLVVAWPELLLAGDQAGTLDTPSSLPHAGPRPCGTRSSCSTPSSHTCGGENPLTPRPAQTRCSACSSRRGSNWRRWRRSGPS